MGWRENLHKSLVLSSKIMCPADFTFNHSWQLSKQSIPAHWNEIQKPCSANEGPPSLLKRVCATQSLRPIWSRKYCTSSRWGFRCFHCYCPLWSTPFHTTLAPMMCVANLQSLILEYVYHLSSSTCIIYIYTYVYMYKYTVIIKHNYCICIVCIKYANY